MPYTVTLSEETFKKLQKLARPLVDTVEDVVARLADEELARLANKELLTQTAKSVDNTYTTSKETYMIINPEGHASLTHTSLRGAKVEGRQLSNAKWNLLLEHLHVLLFRRLQTFDEVQRISSAHLKKGQYEKNGFRYIRSIDISIQGLDANHAWDCALSLAKYLRVSIEVEFRWLDKESAAYPNQLAKMAWSPSNEY